MWFLRDYLEFWQHHMTEIPKRLRNTGEDRRVLDVVNFVF